MISEELLNSKEHSLLTIIEAINSPDISSQERNQRTLEAKQLVKTLMNDVRSMLNEFSLCKKENIDNEQKILLMEQKLDEIEKNHTTTNDYQDSKYLLKEKYGKEWNLLNHNSQQFLITANFLFRMIMNQRVIENDYSPVVLEFCRTFENELRIKVFASFIESRSRGKDVPFYDDSLKNTVGGKFLKAINDMKYSNNFFLTLGDMSYLLESTSQAHIQRGDNNIYNKLLFEFKSKLEMDGWDTSSLSSVTFFKSIKAYSDELRNKSAHPSVMTQKSAQKANEKTKDLIKELLIKNEANKCLLQ